MICFLLRLYRFLCKMYEIDIIYVMKDNVSLVELCDSCKGKILHQHVVLCGIAVQLQRAFDAVC